MISKILNLEHKKCTLELEIADEKRKNEDFEKLCQGLRHEKNLLEKKINNLDLSLNDLSEKKDQIFQTKENLIKKNNERFDNLMNENILLQIQLEKTIQEKRLIEKVWADDLKKINNLSSSSQKKLNEFKQREEFLMDETESETESEKHKNRRSKRIKILVQEKKYSDFHSEN